MSEFNYFRCIPLAIFNTAALGNYQPLNGSGFSAPVKILKFYNESDVGVYISYDGIKDHDYFPPKSTFVLDLQANHQSESNGGTGIKVGRQNQIIYGGGEPGTGNFYISAYY